MPDVGELFVRVRPDTAGFTSEADAGTANAGRSLAKVFLAAFAAVGVGEIIKHTVEAAVSQQQQFAILNKTVSNAGAANEVHGQSIDNLVKQQAALKGFSVADVSTALGKLESVTKNSAQSFQLLGAAENLARGTGKDLTVSALAVQKAYEGSATSLARYGIIIKPVTTDVDRLKEGWAKLRDEGVQFTAQQTQQQAVQLKSATLADKLLTGQEAIAAIQQRFGGESAAFATTAAGEWDRLKVSVDQLEVTIGTEFLPVITKGIGDLTRWATELTNSATVQHDASVAAHDLSVALRDVEDVAQVVGPLLGGIAKAAYETAQAIGAPALIAGAATYTAIKVAVAAADAAQTAYNTVVAAGIPEAEAATAANTEMAGSLQAVAVAGGEADVAAGGLAAFGVGLAALATGLATGPVGLTALLVGVGAGIAYIATETPPATAALHAFASGLEQIGAAVAQVPTDRLTLEQDRLTESQDRAALAALNGKQGTDQYKQAQINLQQAIIQTRTAQDDLSTATQNAQATLATQTSKLQQHAQALATAAKQTADLTVGPQNIAAPPGVQQAARHAAEAKDAAAAANEFAQGIEKITNAQLGNSPVLEHNRDLLAQFAGELHKLPTSTEISLLLNNKDPAAELGQVLSGIQSVQQALSQVYTVTRPTESDYSYLDKNLGGLTEALLKAAQAAQNDTTTGKTHTVLTETAKLSIEQLREGIANASQEQQDLNQQMQDAVQQGAIAVQQSVQQAQQNFITIGQSIATDIGTYIDTPLTLAGNALQLQADRIAAIQQNLVTRFAGQNALLDQETNRISLRAAQLTLHEQRASVELPGGKALSANPATALKELEAAKAKATPAGKFALQQLIDSYQGDVIAVKKAQQAIITGDLNVKEAQKAADIAGKQAHLKVLQDIAANEKAAATNSINDWAAQWEQKKITLTKFDADVATLIKGDIGKLGNIAKVPGGALIEAQLRGALTGLGRQALAIQQGPQSLGAGFLPTIEHPLSALQNEQKQIAGIAHSDATNQTTILADQRNILKQIYGAQKNTAGLGSLSHLTPAQLRRAYDAQHLTGVSGS